MILTCPNCASRFLLAAEVLAPDGRTVRCSNCQETWFQEPDPEELAQDEAVEEIEEESEGQTETQEEPLEDIPDAVKPIPDDTKSDLPTTNHQPLTIKDIGIAALLFIALCIPLIAFKPPIMRSWPESIAFYQIFGAANAIPGESLILDKITADAKDDKITITGQIINLTSKDKIMPLIEVAARDKDGNDLSHWYIAPPQKILNAEETIPLKAEYSYAEADKIADIRVRFTIKKK